ncbi:MAG: FkbM family methyltransferase [Candidatus Dormibacteraeota bacterium]|nr:FkbM family methyltransferase [Candidatus Dormibacteraeota bacterium]
MLDEPLVVVDVGCRWGFADKWERLGDRCISIGFDPDAEECERLRRYYEGRAPQTVLVPLALGAHGGTSTLYQTHDAGGWSVFPPDHDIVERHPSLAGERVEGTTTVPVTTLDDWCAQTGVGRVDVIKVDTQGSELQILEGSVRMLQTARAVEVEVEFNPLFEGAPLFGDVDAFLRAQGFVLWRLRDLAHYAQTEMPTGYRTDEVTYYDRSVTAHRAGAGQLFWANAFYVRRELAYPSQRGWSELVRDACVASSLGFHDLTGMALGRALQDAPAEIVPTLLAAASEDLFAARRKLEMAVRSRELKEPYLLEVSSPEFRGSGWRQPQAATVGHVRWSGPAREASIDLPFVVFPGVRIQLVVAGAITDAVLASLALEVNRVAVAVSRGAVGEAASFEATVPPDYASGHAFTHLVVRTSETLPWNSVHPDTDDDTELGIALLAVNVYPPPD